MAARSLTEPPLTQYTKRRGFDNPPEGCFFVATGGAWSGREIICHEWAARGVLQLRTGDRETEAATAMTETALTPARAADGGAAPLDFETAFALHHRAVYGAAYSLLRDAGLAEDVTQEVFMRLHSHRDSVPQDELLRPWLLRVALNLSYNQLRGRSRSTAREEEFARQSAPEGAAGRLDHEFEQRVEIEEARRALQKIDEPMRSCLLLKQQGLSYKEIAAAVSVKEDYVGSLIARGRKEFARVYGKIGVRK